MAELMHGVFTFAGVSSADLGLKVERIPNSDRPERKVDRYEVPGRNGDIIVPQDAWENVEQSYEVWGMGGAVELGYKIAAWLFAPEGYQILTDTYDPDHYRRAVFLGPFDLENILLKYGRTEITFDCDPRRFLSDAEEITLEATGMVTNPTAFTAKPVITVHGEGAGTITAGGNTISIAGIVDGMILDCEAMDAYQGVNNLNNLVSGSFPVLPGGEQEITLTGGVTSITVAPNWWTL